MTAEVFFRNMLQSRPPASLLSDGSSDGSSRSYNHRRPNETHRYLEQTYGFLRLGCYISTRLNEIYSKLFRYLNVKMLHIISLTKETKIQNKLTLQLNKSLIIDQIKVLTSCFTHKYKRKCSKNVNVKGFYSNLLRGHFFIQSLLSNHFIIIFFALTNFFVQRTFFSLCVSLKDDSRHHKLSSYLLCVFMQLMIYCTTYKQH